MGVDGVRARLQAVHPLIAAEPKSKRAAAIQIDTRLLVMWFPPVDWVN